MTKKLLQKKGANMPTKFFEEKESAIDKQIVKEPVKEYKHEKAEKSEKDHKDQKDAPDNKQKQEKEKHEKEQKSEKEHKNENKEHKPEKEHKIEGKEYLLEKTHKDAGETQPFTATAATPAAGAEDLKVTDKSVLADKLPRPETKLHKLEIKEVKHEIKEIKHEIKEFKNELKEFKLEKEFKVEKYEYETLPGSTDPGGPVEQRLASLEAAVTQLLHFIPENLRPDLTQGALKQEPDVAKQASTGTESQAEAKTGQHKAKS
jgi:hypothetical protein